MIRPLSDRLSALIVANFAAAASVGFAAMMIVAAYVMLTPPGLSNGIPAMISGVVILAMSAAIAATITAFLFFLMGLILIGIPTWWVLHRAGWTTRFPFIAVAAVESVLGGFFVAPLFLPPEAFAFVWILALPGGLAGWVIWRLGYNRKLRPLPPAPPSPS